MNPAPLSLYRSVTAILSDDIKTGKEHKRNAGGSDITQAYYNHLIDPALDFHYVAREFMILSGMTVFFLVVAIRKSGSEN